MHIRHFFLSLIALLSTFFCYAEWKQLSTVNILQTDGLLSNTVYDLTQDADGYIWIATPYGLYRYDGKYLLKYFKESDGSGINSNLIGTVASDTVNNQIWIGNMYSGVNVFDIPKKKFFSFRHDPKDRSSLSSNIINDIFIDALGNPWIATGVGVDRYDRETDQFYRYNHTTIEGFPAGEVRRVIRFGNKLAIAHQNQGLTILDVSDGSLVRLTHDNHDSLPSDDLSALYVDDDGLVWTGTDAGLSIYDINNDTLINLASAPHIHPSLKGSIQDICESSDGMMWIGTLSDLCYFSKKDLAKIVCGDQEADYSFIRDYTWGISNPTVYSVMEDSFGNLWVGSNGAGVSFIDRMPQMFSSWRINKIPGIVNGLNDKEILSICVIDDHNMLLGTDGGGFTLNIDGDNSRTFNADNSNASSYAYSNILKTRGGEIFCGYFNGIDIFDMEHLTIKNMLQFPEGYMYSMTEDNDSRVWCGFNLNGILIYDPKTGEQQSLSYKNSKLPKTAVTALSCDKHSDVWIGTTGFGLYKYDHATGEIERFEGISDGEFSVNHIYFDTHDRLWVATDIGLVNLSGPNFSQARIYDEKDGLVCTFVQSIIEGANSHLWVSTNLGISCLNIENGELRNFAVDDGVLPGPYLRHSVGRRTDGTIYFGSMNGVCYFNENNLDAPCVVTAPRITSFYLLGDIDSPRPMRIPINNGRVDLKHSQDNFTVTFSVMNKSIVSRCEYAYNMDGLTKEWISTGHTPQVTFHNLPSGTYRLKVRARLSNQDWSDDYSVLTIRIASSPWLSVWAIIGYIIVLVSISYLLWHFRQRILSLKLRHKQMEEEISKNKDVKQTFINDSMSEKERDFITRLTSVIETRISEDKIDVNEVAAELGLSYSTLYRKVKTTTSLTISDFIKKIRVHKAEELLLTGKYSISEISQMVGLNSVSYFRECFKQEYGMSPTQWVNKIKSES